MGYIRKRTELKTGYQEIENWAPELDLQCDFIMTYGLNDTLKQRIDTFRSKGYEVHLMTGCAWGTYEDYLNGEWDGKNHWDECQMDRNGEKIMHGVNIPYMVPTMNFVTYLTEKLCALVDYGISAIHMEEPEFWDAGGYSSAFQKEYEDYYKEKWQAPHSCITARYRCSALKAWLYARLIDHLSRAIKAYSKEKYNRDTAFYVATHSLVNYTQWKIMSPVSRMSYMQDVDGFIAQVWSGTSGTGNVYEGHYKGRTFETAYLEYGSMQELIHGIEKKMWFLHDPVEDFPENTWDIYRKKYIKTVVASLFWPKVDHYEVCPWPNRVFNGRYPRKLGMADGMIPTTDMDGAKNIPPEYATMLSSMIQTLGNMHKEEATFLGNKTPVGILISNTSLYQRSFPDKISTTKDSRQEILLKGTEEAINQQILSLRETEQETIFYQKIADDPQLFYSYIASCTYPAFFGLAMPLLKHGLPIRLLYLDYVKAQKDYLSSYRYFIVSYEFMKPENPYCNEALATWVKEGGCLIYLGDNSDPYHKVRAWWNQNGTNEKTPSEHLLEQLGLHFPVADGIYPVGKGKLAIFQIAPSILTADKRQAARYRQFVKNVLLDTGYAFQETNYLAMKRGPYLIVAVMDESYSNDFYTSKGLYTDLLADGFPVIKKISIPAGSEGLFFDYDTISDEKLCIIATAARVEKLECSNHTFTLWEKAADRILVYTRIRLPFQPKEIVAEDEDGNIVSITFEWEEESKTILLSYPSKDKLVKIIGFIK